MANRIFKHPLRMSMVSVVVCEAVYLVIYLVLDHDSYVGFYLSGILPILVGYPMTSIIFRKNKALEKAKQLIQDQNEELEELNAIKDKLFSLVAHEMRSPINSLKGLLSLLEEDGIDREQFKQFSITLNGQLRSTSEMLDNLLVWAKTQLKGMNTSPQDFDIHEMVEKVMRLLTDRAEQKQITLCSSLDTGLKVFADPNMMELVIRNLVINALKFTPNGGSVMIWANETPSSVHLSIEDSGIGIDKNEIKDIFKPKANHGTRGTNNEDGFGLGLIMCKDFVQLNNGDIDVQSEIGKGSTFTISIPKFRNN